MRTILKTVVILAAIAFFLSAIIWDFVFKTPYWVGIGVCLIAYAAVYGMRFFLSKKFKRFEETAEGKAEKEAEEALHEEIASIKGNWLKKQLVSRKLIKDYCAAHQSDKGKRIQGQIHELEGWRSTVGWATGIVGYFAFVSLFWLLLALLFFFLPVYITTWSSLGFLVVANVAVAVTATGVLIWKRRYTWGVVTGVLALVYMYGISHTGLSGLETQALNTLAENEEFYLSYVENPTSVVKLSLLFLSCISVYFAIRPWTKGWATGWLIASVIGLEAAIGVVTHNDYGFSIYQMTPLYDFTTQCVVTADLAVMLGISYAAMLGVEFVYLPAVLATAYSLPATVWAWRRYNEQGDRCSRRYIVCGVWFLLHVIVLAMVIIYNWGMSLDEVCGTMLKNVAMLSMYYRADLKIVCQILFYAIPLCDALVSWGLYWRAKKQVKIAA